MNAPQVHRHRPINCLVVVAVFFLSFMPAAAMGQEWNFDPECSGAETSPVELAKPAAMLMLDRSGSMGRLAAEFCCGSQTSGTNCRSNHLDSNGCGWCCGDQLWDVAVNAIKQAVDTLNENLYFGLGLFYGDTTAVIRREATETSWQQIGAILDSESPAGRTPTGQAIRRIRTSATLNDENLAAAGVLITDGFPNDPNWALSEACLTRESGQTLYIVGLGGGTDVQFNNMLAAAAGTGCCGAMCNGGTADDPCTSSVNPAICEGSHQAYNQAEFADVLLSISEEIACTFPLDTSHWPGGIPDDPAAVKVNVNGPSGVPEPVPHRSVGGTNSCNSDESCDLGMCRDLDDACSSHEQCRADDPDNFCHPRLGCQDSDDQCSGNYDCDEGDFCWLGICKDADDFCADDGDCDSDQLCDGGLCRDLDDFCRTDSDCETQNSNHFCHDRMGCEDISDRCTRDSDCDSGDYCWRGLCSGAVSGGGAQCSGGGWYFASSNREQVTFTSNYCARIRNPDDIQSVETIVACSCESMYAGRDCMMSEAFATACPVGKKACRPDQTWFCEGPAYPAGQDCPFTNCPTYTEPQLCHLENELKYYHHPVHARFEDEGDYDPDTERNRCNVGVVRCAMHTGGWCEPLSPMPELCDGMDNDCDGRLDNLSASWSSAEFGHMSLPPDYQYRGAACYENDWCRCPSGVTPRHGGLAAVMNGGDWEAEWLAYLDDWRPESEGGCLCQDSFTP